MKRKIFILLIIVNLVFNSFANDVLEISNPSNARNDEYNYLIEHDTFYISYNNSLLIPNWVGWHVDKKDLSSGRYSGIFIADNKLPKSWVKVQHKDYSNSGYDRGHLCPNADRNAYEKGKETFITTNIVPQTPECNRGVWKNFEEYCRIIVENNNYETYIYAGVYGEIGVMSSKNISIHEYCWKVVIILEEGENDLNRINKDTETISVWIPNDSNCSEKDWECYIVNIRYIEDITGYDFLENTSKDIQDVIENRTYKMK